jgi:translocation and assembly module TamB
VGLSENFRVEYEQVANVYGELLFFRGRADVLGREFEVQKESQVRFTGPAKRPYVNFTAVHKNAREDITVFVNLRGQGKDVSLKVSSQPPLAETEIYTLLATGRRTLKRGSGASVNTGDAATVLGSLAASQLKKSLATKLPLDVVSIQTGGTEGNQLSVEAGKYLTDTIYVGYTQRLNVGDEVDEENSTAIRAEWQIAPGLSLEGEVGQRRVAGDLIWSRDY